MCLLYEVKDNLELISNTVKNRTNISMKTLRVYCGLKYKHFKTKFISDKFNIKYETTVPYTPQQNGKVEHL